MSRQGITNQKLIILWATVVVAYVLLIVLMNPVITMPEARQREIFERASAAVCEARATIPAFREDGSPENHVAIGVQQAADEFGLTYRAAYLIYRHGNEQGWPSSCEG